MPFDIEELNAFLDQDARMKLHEVQEEARRRNKTEREVCIEWIAELKNILHHVSDDYMDLKQDSFNELVEKEVDSYISHEMNNESE